MKDRYLLGQGQRRVLGIQDTASVYRGEVPPQQGVAPVTPAAQGPPPAQQLVGTLTHTELDELKPWLLAVTLGSTGNTDLAAGYLACDVVKIHDGDDSHELSLVWNESESSANRTLNFLVHGGNRTIDLYENLKVLDGQDIELHASGGEKAQLAVDTQNAERTLDMSENLTIADGYNVTLQALGQANSLVLNESLTVGDGNSGTITFGNASDVLTINETMTLAGASGKTLTLNENLTIGDGTDITITGVTAARTLTLNENFTIGNGYDGTITFSAASKVLTVDESETLSNYHTDARGDARYYTKTEFDTWASSVIQQEMDYLDGVTSDIQDQLDARCLESVFGISVSTGLTLDGTALKASTVLQTYHGIDPTANVQALLGAADYAAMMALLSATAGATFDINDQQISNIKSLAFNDGGAVVTQVKDEDNMVSDSATMLATQQSIKKYVDDSVVAAGGHAILDGNVHTDSVADAVTRGSIIYGNATPKWDELVKGNADTFLGAGADDISWRTPAQVMASLSGGATAAFALNAQNLTGVGTIGCGSITTTGDYLLANGNYVGISANERLGFYAAGYAAFLGCDVGIGTTPPYSPLDIRQTAGIYVGGLLLRQVATNDTWSFMEVNTHLYIAYANDASGGNATADFAEKLVLQSDGTVTIVAHNAATVGLKLGATLVTASAIELNLLDGVTATTAELNQLDGNVFTAGLTVTGSVTPNVDQGGHLGSSTSHSWTNVYCCNVVDSSCAYFGDYSIQGLYQMFSQIKPRTDGLLHVSEGTDKHYPYIDFATVPEEFGWRAEKDYERKTPRYNNEGGIVEGLVSFKQGDPAAIDRMVQQDALIALTVKLYEQNQDLITRIRYLEKNTKLN